MHLQCPYPPTDNWEAAAGRKGIGVEGGVKSCNFLLIFWNLLKQSAIRELVNIASHSQWSQ